MLRRSVSTPDESGRAKTSRYICEPSVPALERWRYVRRIHLVSSPWARPGRRVHKSTQIRRCGNGLLFLSLPVTNIAVLSCLQFGNLKIRIAVCVQILSKSKAYVFSVAAL